ncbi:hypothetical protein [Enterococcus crotali]|uniref:hypothetical protein n=1 Tax=Enterococcus crotali TaxID=1453587 RepID=UPI00046F0628|nr:hypothetical protein [Enterococcus crotali]
MFSRDLNAFIPTASILRSLTFVHAQVHSYSLCMWMVSWLITFVVIVVSSSFLPKLITVLVKR